MNTYDFIFQIVEIYAPLIPLLCFFIRRPKRSVWINFLISYLTVYILLVYSANHFKPFFAANNHIAYTVLFGTTFCFFALILEQFLIGQKFKFFNRAVIIIAVLFFIANAIWWEGTNVFNTYSSGIANFILAGYCVYYYKLQLEKLQIIFVEKLPSFWIVSGIFIYSAGNIFLFSMFNSLARNYPNVAYELWNINIILIVIMNIFFAKGIQCNWQK